MSKVVKNPYILVFIIQSVISIILCLILLFKGNGYVVYVDVTEGETFINSINKFIYTFDDNWGEAIAEKQRLVPMFILISVFKILFLDQQNFVPLKFLLFYILTNISFLLSTYLLVKSLKIKSSNKLLFTAIFFASFFYLYNPWMTNRLMHFFLFLTSFTIPISFAITLKYFYSSGKNYFLVFILGIFLGLWTTTPHTFLLYTFICLPFIGYAIYKKMFKKLFIYLIGVFVITLLTGAFWIFPFLFSNATPDRLESIDIFNMLSKNASLLNNLKLQGYWWPGLPSYSFQLGVIYDYIFGIIYLIPAFIPLIFILLKKINRSVKFLLILIFAIGIFFSTYQLSYYFYNNLVFNTPVQKVGWLFRETEKIAYLIAFSYSIMVMFLVLFLQRTYKIILLVVLFPVLILYFCYTFFLIQSNFSKASPPVAYKQLIQMLDTDNDTFNVGVYPQVQYTSWSNMDTSNYFINLSLNKPVLPLSEQDSRTKYYFNYLFTEKNIPNIDISRELSLLGVKYLVIRDDLKYQNTKGIQDLLNSKEGLIKIANYGELAVYKNLNYKGLVSESSYTIYTNLGLETLNHLYISGINPSLYNLDYIDLNAIKINKNAAFLLNSAGIVDLAINNFISYFDFPSKYILKTDPNPSFANLSLVDKTHGESTFYFNNNQIKVGQFNFDKELAFSMGGAEVKYEPLLLLSKKIDFTFQSSNYYNVSKDLFNRVTLKYNEIKTGNVWDIAETNEIKVNNNKALLVAGEVNAPYILEPHIKISYYTANNSLIETQAFYPNYNYKIYVVSKVPFQSNYYKLSLWSRGGAYNTLPFEFKNLSLTDVSTNYKNPNIVFKYKNKCTIDCIAFARIIKSPNGGTLNIKINGNNNFINTKSVDTLGGLYWQPLGPVGVGDLSIEAVNVKGVNAFATFFVVNKDEYAKAVQASTNLINSFPKKINFNNQSYLYYYDSLFENNYQNQVSYTKESPVEIKVKNLSVNNYLTLGKAYSPNWTLNGTKSTLTNGFINGWVVKDTEGVIYYEPQKYFYLGLLVSVISTITITTFLLAKRHQLTHNS